VPSGDLNLIFSNSRCRSRCRTQTLKNLPQNAARVCVINVFAPIKIEILIRGGGGSRAQYRNIQHRALDCSIMLALDCSFAFRLELEWIRQLPFRVGAFDSERFFGKSCEVYYDYDWQIYRKTESNRETSECHMKSKSKTAKTCDQNAICSQKLFGSGPPRPRKLFFVCAFDCHSDWRALHRDKVNSRSLLSRLGEDAHHSEQITK
jgi:hypothetical protein